MARLVVVSNRVALPRERNAQAGGLAVALREALNRTSGLWFGWSGEVSERPATAPTIVTSKRVTYATLDLSPAHHDAFYLGYANSTLWPLFHYRLGLIDFRRASLEGYLQVNEIFADALVPLLRPDDLIWVHDYHFIPLAAALRKRGVRNRIGFFLHIPFPAPEVLTALPGHDTLVRVLFDYDLVGFQTESDRVAFNRYILDEFDGRIDQDGTASAGNQGTLARAFPIGIDTQEFERLALKAANGSEIARLRDSLTGRNLIIGVDRLDYSKGLPKRFEAYQEFLSRYPDYRRKVTFMQIAPISRGGLAQYRSLRRELEGMAGRINGKYAEFDWMPMRYLNKALPRTTLVALFRAARIGMVTPIRDGMNLVAKEFVAAQNPDDPGALILSRFAGAAHELDGALLVNPFDTERVTEVIDEALKMPIAERRERWQRMIAVLRANT
ncbi:MAG TPA: trehalose-6-phosphate synthase, partial [Roseiflexaceae bacterium]|nr:trehalose-6-phosphate synthase [Roseiflexaceae bacterium]